MKKTAAAVVVDAEYVQTIRDSYAASFESTAQWREQKAAEFPDDGRNAQSAAGLYALEEWFSGLPDVHPLLVRLAAACERNAKSDDNYAVTEEEKRLISRFHFGTEESFADFIEILIQNITPDDPLEEKRRESRLRRALAREGYTLRKSRARTWRLDDQQGYMIVDPSLNIAVSQSDFSWSLDDVEGWINNE